jgi:FKBP-type peptidyl-prolyl cis-trans isomerase
MKKLSRNEWIAVAIAIIVVGLFLWPVFSNSLNSTQSAQSVGQAASDDSSTATTNNVTTSIQNTMANQLQIQDTTVGTGATAAAGDTVSVLYVGKLTDGKVFDSTSAHGGQPFTFTLGAGQVIQGWDQGLIGMKVGGERVLTIPSDLGYGAQGAGGVIPPNATLIFDVKLVKIAGK